MSSFFKREAPTPEPTLEKLEEAIQAGLAAMETTGLALEVIQKRKLYAPTFGTFDEYLQARWKMSRNYADKLIDAGRICQQMREAGLPTPIRESHARQLNKIADPDQRVKTWKDTLDQVGNDPENVTADVVAKLAAPHRRRTARKKAPKAVVIKGKGWNLKIERKTADIDVVAVLKEALDRYTEVALQKVA